MLYSDCDAPEIVTDKPVARLWFDDVVAVTVVPLLVKVDIPIDCADIVEATWVSYWVPSAFWIRVEIGIEVKATPVKTT